MFKRERSDLFWIFVLFVLPMSCGVTYGLRLGMHREDPFGDMPELLALFFLYQEVDQTRRKWWIRALLWMIPLLLLVALADVYIHPWAGLLLVTTVLFIVHFWQKPSESGSSLWSKLRSKTPDSAS